MTKSLFFKSFVVLIFIAFYYTNANACPPQFDPWPSVPWIDAGCIVIDVDYNGKICATNVCYCWRNVGIVAPFTEIYVYSHVLEDPTCTEMGYQSRSRLVGEQLIKTNPHNLNWACPPCPIQTANYNVYIDACTNGFGSCNNNSYCRQTYLVCCDQQTGIKSVIKYGGPMILGLTCDDGCSSDCQ